MKVKCLKRTKSEDIPLKQKVNAEWQAKARAKKYEKKSNKGRGGGCKGRIAGGYSPELLNHRKSHACLKIFNGITNGEKKQTEAKQST